VSTETRTVRPFVGVEGLEDALEGSVLHFGLDRCPGAGDNRDILVDLLPEEFLRRSISLEWAPDDEAFSVLKKQMAKSAEEAGIKLAALSLWVIAENAYMKHSDPVFKCSLDKLKTLERKVDLVDLIDGNKARAPAFLCPSSGFRVTAYILLSQPRKRTPLSPHLIGTWLAKSKFGVHTSASQGGFSMTPLTKEEREKLGLPKQTMRFFEFGDHNVFEPHSGQNPPLFYVDDGLLSQLQAHKTPPSEAIQLQLALDMQLAIIRQALVEINSGDGGERDRNYDDVKTSLVGGLIRAAAGPGATGKARDIWLEHLRDQPEKVIAGLEDRINVRKSILGMFVEDAS